MCSASTPTTRKIKRTRSRGHCVRAFGARRGGRFKRLSTPWGCSPPRSRCPQKPDAACLHQRIGDQLHTDRFVWGVMSKVPRERGHGRDSLVDPRASPSVVAKETYSDNLQDQNDETLRKIATRVLDKLAGITTKGTLTVHAGDADGVVWINGQKNRALEHGAAMIELIPGRYDIEVRAPGFATATQEGVVVNPGQDTSVPLKMVALALPVAAAAAPESKGNARRVLGWTLIGLGGRPARSSPGSKASSFSLCEERSRQRAGASALHDHGRLQQRSSTRSSTAWPRMLAANTTRQPPIAWWGSSPRAPEGRCSSGGWCCCSRTGRKSRGGEQRPCPERTSRAPAVPALALSASPRGTGGGVEAVLTF